MCVAAAIISCKSLHIKKEVKSIIMPIISALTAVSLLYELFDEKFALQGVAWQVVLMKIFGGCAVLYFGVFAASEIFKFQIPDILHTIPALYMIMRIICSFINISSLSLIAENIFLLASYCCMLLFFVSYAAFYCIEDQNIVSLYTRASLAFAFGFCTALPNIIANTFSKSGYTHIPVHSQVVLMFMALFIAGFVYEKFFKAEKQ